MITLVCLISDQPLCKIAYISLAGQQAAKLRMKKAILNFSFLHPFSSLSFKTPRKEPAVQGRSEIIKVVENH